MKEMKENNYTIEELENLFSEAELEAIADLEDDMKKTMKERGKEDSGMHLFSFSLQNMMAINTAKKMFFKKVKGEDSND